MLFRFNISIIILINDVYLFVLKNFFDTFKKNHKIQVSSKRLIKFTFCVIFSLDFFGKNEAINHGPDWGDCSTKSDDWLFVTETTWCSKFLLRWKSPGNDSL